MPFHKGLLFPDKTWVQKGLPCSDSSRGFDGCVASSSHHYSQVSQALSPPLRFSNHNFDNFPALSRSNPVWVARKSSMGGLYVCVGGLTFAQGGLDIQIWQIFHWLIVFQISIWGVLELCLGGISPPKPPELLQNLKLDSRSAVFLFSFYLPA